MIHHEKSKKLSPGITLYEKRKEIGERGKSRLLCGKGEKKKGPKPREVGVNGKTKWRVEFKEGTIPNATSRKGRDAENRGRRDQE